MKNITRVYTRTGDKGETGLIGGVRISKADIRLESYGTIDELNSLVGLLATYVDDKETEETLTQIQKNLFTVGSHLATDQSKTPLAEWAKIDAKEATLLETAMDKIMAELPEKQGFVLPGGCRGACMAHVCRTVCRRAERRIVALAEEAEVGQEIVTYVNRLSDYFFVLAKKLNFVCGIKEKKWDNSCR